MCEKFGENFQQDSRKEDADERKRTMVTGKLSKNGTQSEEKSRSTENSRSWLKDTFPPGWGRARSRKKEKHEGEKTKKRMEEVRVEENSDAKRKRKKRITEKS